jgi:RNA polymerase sigma-70 factor (ECF subfamily)
MNELSFRSLIDAHSDDLLYYVRCFSLSKEEAEEIVSDTFFELWQVRDNVHEILNLKGWLVTIAHNKTISYLRKRKARGRSVSWDEMGDFIAPGRLQTPDEQVISQESMARINRSIRELPPRCQQVFVLAKIERMPYKEIANVLGISVKTINIHIAKALRIIAGALEKII